MNSAHAKFLADLQQNNYQEAVNAVEFKKCVDKIVRCVATRKTRTRYESHPDATDFLVNKLRSMGYESWKFDDQLITIDWSGKKDGWLT